MYQALVTQKYFDHDPDDTRTNYFMLSCGFLLGAGLSLAEAYLLQLRAELATPLAAAPPESVDTAECTSERGVQGEEQPAERSEADKLRIPLGPSNAPQERTTTRQ